MIEGSWILDLRLGSGGGAEISSPSLRSLAVDTRGAVYAAATGCRAY